MEKVKFLVIILGLASLTACHRGLKQTTSIEMSTDNSSMKVEYSGSIKFDSTKTAIASMAPGAYLKYKKNGEKLIAECGRDGIINYRVNGADKVTQLPSDGKQILIQAIKVVSDSQARQPDR